MRTVATVMVVSILASPIAAQESGRWMFSCLPLPDGGPKAIACSVSYDAAVPDLVPETAVSLMFLDALVGPATEPTLSVTTWHRHSAKPPGNRLCYFRLAEIWVDGAKAATFGKGPIYDSAQRLDQAETRPLVETLLAATTVELVVHNLPDCAPRTVPVSMESFAAAWRRYEEEPR